MNLSDRFINHLKKLYPIQKELVCYISQILNIEKESASRRLNRKVQFTVQELGLLANSLDISIDNLIFQKQNTIPVIFHLDISDKSNAMELLEEQMKHSLDSQMLLSDKDMSVGVILDSLPIEWYMYHPNIENSCILNGDVPIIYMRIMRTSLHGRYRIIYIRCREDIRKIFSDINIFYIYWTILFYLT